MKPVRVLIVDDHEIIRVGLRTVLSRGDRIKMTRRAQAAAFFIRNSPWESDQSYFSKHGIDLES